MGKEIKRMRYFDGLFLNAQDYTLDQEYQRRLQRLHNRYLHTWGILTGLEVVPAVIKVPGKPDNCMCVSVNEGLAINKVEVGEGDEKESISQEILIYKNHPDNPLDLSTYMPYENIYIFLSYDEVWETPKNEAEIEKGKGQEIHILERGRIKHGRQIPTDPWKNIILARVIPKLVGKDKVIEADCIFDKDVNGAGLRTYAGPAGSELALEKLIFRLGENSTGPYMKAIKDGPDTGIEINSPFMDFKGTLDVTGDLIVHGDIRRPDGSTGAKGEVLVSNSFVQVNTPPPNETRPAQDGGLEVYRGGNGENNARLIWVESKSGEKNGNVWKAGIGNTLNNIAYGPQWEQLIQNGFNDHLHKHKKLSSPKGDALVVDDSGNLSVNGDLAMNDKTLWLRGDPNHGLGWFGPQKPFAGREVNGPALFGYDGGLLGTTSVKLPDNTVQKKQQAALSWNSYGNVGIGTANPKDDKLDVAGSLCILSDTNPIRFTSGWSGFSPYTGNPLNHAEISNDTSAYKALMIVGNKSAGHERRVAIWDRLDVNGYLYVNGSMQVSQALTPSAGKLNNGIIFPMDPGGGGGDRAWIKYFPRSGEACTLEIGTSDNPDDHIALVASGNVGIGTTAPADKLDVSGWTRIMTGSNPIRFTSQWTGFPDNALNQAEICNDTTYYKTLMIVGNRSDDRYGRARKVSVWDRLDVNGFLYVDGNLQATGYIMPSVGNSEANGIMFPKDPYGGSGDAAWIRYYSDTSRGGGENMTLEIGIGNDGAYNWSGGDRLSLFASGGVYMNGNMYVSSSREYKDNINSLPTQKAKEILDGLNPVTFNFKGDTEKIVMGFIAEDVPKEVSARDQKAISPVEIIAALTGVVKDQRKTLTKLQKQIESLSGTSI